MKSPEKKFSSIGENNINRSDNIILSFGRIISIQLLWHTVYFVTLGQNRVWFKQTPTTVLGNKTVNKTSAYNNKRKASVQS